MSNTEEMSPFGPPEEMPVCRNCGDSWENHSSTSQCLWSKRDGATTHYEPLTKEDVQSQEHPEEI
jgi:hypothetical protein